MSIRRSAAAGMIWWLPAIALIGSNMPGCGGGKTTGGSIPTERATVVEATHSDAEDSALVGEPGPFRFVDILPGSGVDFVHVSGTTPDKLFPTANGSGVAVFDYDGDGKVDLYFATGNLLPLSKRPVASNRLYKNLGGGKFRDETEHSGLGFRGLLPRYHRR